MRDQYYRTRGHCIPSNHPTEHPWLFSRAAGNTTLSDVKYPQEGTQTHRDNEGLQPESRGLLLTIAQRRSGTVSIQTQACVAPESLLSLAGHSGTVRGMPVWGLQSPNVLRRSVQTDSGSPAEVTQEWVTQA